MKIHNIMSNKAIESEPIFYKERKKDKIWWVDYQEEIGRLEISFDKKKILNLFEDYPHNFTNNEKQLFDKENPYWRDFFNGRV